MQTFQKAQIKMQAIKKKPLRKGANYTGRKKRGVSINKARTHTHTRTQSSRPLAVPICDHENMILISAVKKTNNEMLTAAKKTSQGAERNVSLAE